MWSGLRNFNGRKKKKATWTGGQRLLRDIATRGQGDQMVEMNVIFEREILATISDKRK